MSSFANLTASLNLNIQNFAKNIRRASSIANQFSANLKGQINEGLVEPAKKSKFEFKDVARIVQGIIVSKVFYKGLNVIRNCTSAVWEFSQELEYAKIAYSNLFGDTALTDEFINVLKDFAATTPFSFQESEAAAKRLLAYGIQYKNVMYVMQGVLAASSVQGNPQVIESVSRALGQIYTKGRLMNEEMRQLAEAGIPAYEILQQKLGLTQEQLRNISKECIPASKAINALVDGMTERFGGVVYASSKTLKGIISNIKDNAVMLVSGAFEPLFTKIKSGLNVLGEFLFKMREIFELKGLGGVFEAIFPPELHSTIRMYVANLKAVQQAILRLVASLSGLLKPVLEALLRVYNAFAPILTTILNVLSVMVSWIAQNATAMKILTAAIASAAAMWVVFKVKALATAVVAGVINLISKALAGLSAMLTLVAAHPFWSLLIALTGLVVGLSGGFGKLSDAISGIFKKITAINGIDPDKILLPSQKERANDLNKFNKALDGTKDAMDDLADSTGKATKAAKGLLSFDEVFKLKQPDEGTNKGIDTDTDFDIPDLSGLDASSFIPEIPSFEGFANNFVTNMVNALKEKFIGAGIGAIIGGILGGILGGPLGAKIGAIAGAIAGWFWDDLANALGLTDVGKVALPISTGLGAAIGAIIGGPFGAVIGAGIGALVGWLIDAIARGFEDGDWSQVGYPIGIGLGAAIGFVVGGPAGAAVGTAIGVLVGWFIDKIAEALETGDWSTVTRAGGTGLGAAIGMIVGGPVGALIGGAIGRLVGWFINEIAEALETGDWSTVTLAGGTGLGAAIGMMVGGPVGALIGGAIGTLVGWLLGLIIENWDSITAWFGEAATKIGEFFQGIWNTIAEKVGGAWDTITEKFQGIWNTISEKVGGAWDTVTEKFQGIWDTISEKVSGARNTVSERFQGIWDTIKEKTSGAWDTVTEKFQGIGDTISEKVGGAWNTVSERFQGIWDTIKEKVGGARNSVSEAFSDIYGTTSEKISDMYNSVKGGVKNIYRAFTDWIGDMWDNVFGKFFDWIGSAIDKLKDFFGLNSKAKSTDISYADGGSSGTSIGHATGGIFNREHIARFAEGNKAEAVIPLENAGAMQPFVDAVANGITASLMPIIANISGSQGQLQPLYVGTLIADERSLKELSRKMQIIQLQENKRRG